MTKQKCPVTKGPPATRFVIGRSALLLDSSFWFRHSSLIALGRIPQQPPQSSQHAPLVLPASRRIRQDSPRQSRERQRLEPDRPRAGDGGEEESLAAEERVLDAAGHLDVVLHTGLERDDAAGVDAERLAGA